MQMQLELCLHDTVRSPVAFSRKSVDSWAIRAVCADASKIDLKVLDADNWQAKEQCYSGYAFKPGDVVTFTLHIRSAEQLCVQVELLKQLKRTLNWAVFAVGEISHRNLEIESGSLEIPLLSSKNQSKMGNLFVDYAFIKPWRDYPLSTENAVHFKNALELGSTVIIGHRGCGSTKHRDERLLENTIASFQRAHECGATWVELDTFLTADMVPIVFHDYCASMIKDGESSGTSAQPVHKLTLEALRTSRMDFAPAKLQPDDKQGSKYEPGKYKQLFPTLQEVLSKLPKSIGLIVEVKYPLQEKDTLAWEVSDFHDRNVLVDRVLDVVADHCGARPLILCSFDPRVCVMLQRKQRLFPVVYISCGENLVYAKYADIRLDSVEKAGLFALSENLKGVSLFANPLVDDRPRMETALALMRKHGRLMFTWGESNMVDEIRDYQRLIGVSGIIMDRVDELLSPCKSAKPVGSSAIPKLGRLLKGPVFVNVVCVLLITALFMIARAIFAS